MKKEKKKSSNICYVVSAQILLYLRNYARVFFWVPNNIITKTINLK